MAKIKQQDIKELATEELHQRIVEGKDKYTKMKFNHAVSSIENPLSLKNLRKDIARFSTELRKREIELNSNNGGKETN